MLTSRDQLFHLSVRSVDSAGILASSTALSVTFWLLKLHVPRSGSSLKSLPREEEARRCLSLVFVWLWCWQWCSLKWSLRAGSGVTALQVRGSVKISQHQVSIRIYLCNHHARGKCLLGWTHRNSPGQVRPLWPLPKTSTGCFCGCY